MNSSALWILGVFLVSPAWSQELSFDLKSDALKNIVRATAATQFNQIQPVEPQVGRKPDKVVDLHFTEKPPVKPAAPTPSLPSVSSEPLSALIDVLLGYDDDVMQEIENDKRIACQWRDGMVPPAPHVETCKG